MKFSDLFEIAENDVFVVGHFFRCFRIVENFQVVFYHQQQITSEFFFGFNEFTNDRSNCKKKFLFFIKLL